MSIGIHKTRGYSYHWDTVLQSQYEHATIIYEEIANLYEQPHAKNIDVTHKERPGGSQSRCATLLYSLSFTVGVWDLGLIEGCG